MYNTNNHAMEHNSAGTADPVEHAHKEFNEDNIVVNSANSSLHRLYSNREYSALLQTYLCAAILGNFCMFFFDGHGGDIGFWMDWVKQLAAKGYAEFNGNYPPIYIHWLYLIGQLYNLLNMPVENNVFLKFLTQLPVLCSHLLLVSIIFLMLKQYAHNKLHFHTVMLLSALNPAILFNGPVWGQIDVIPVIPVLLALLASFSPKWRLVCIPLYTLALLTKFQMIAFAPVFGIIFFRDMKVHLIGIALSLVVIATAFLPSILSDNFLSAFKLAYIDVVKQYGRTTMGASNIWILLTGNAAPDTIVLFNINPQSFLAPLFRAKYFGILLFFLVCLGVFIKGMAKVISRDDAPLQKNRIGETIFYAMICCAAFFIFLPAMHERYLLPAVIVSLVYYTVAPNRGIYVLGFTFVSTFNLAMTLGIKTSSVWPAISWVMLAVFSYALMEFLFGKSWHKSAVSIWQKIVQTKYVSLWFLLSITSCTFFYLYKKNIIHTPTFEANQMLLTELRPDYAQQDFGRLQIHKNVRGEAITAGGKRYAYGIGTHAHSRIDYTLPDNVLSLSFIVGLDNAIESADVQFSVMGDNQLLWQSPIHYKVDKNLPTTEIDLRGITKLSLRISGLDSISNDHANWINPILTINKISH
jgi:Gpi18-like mannosyltransferase